MSPTSSIEKLDKNFAPTEIADGLHWYDIRTFGVEGRGWDDTERFYDRLPAKAKTQVRDHVWELSHHSTGMCVRFVTDAPQVTAKWTLFRNSLAMDHMPATGVSGLDLYAKLKGEWIYAGTGRPLQFPTNTANLTNNLGPGKREYLLYLPLYNGVESVSIGLPPDAKISPAPKRKGKLAKGFVVYGTSIVQGGCASRAGMGYPEIMARALDCHNINLGFSGNGPMELEIARLLVDLDPAVFVLDCLPNMATEWVTERTQPFVDILRAKRPKTPIVLVENVYYSRWPLVTHKQGTGHEEKNRLLKIEYKKMQKRGIKGLHYVPAAKLLGDDSYGTVDGVHPTDLGFFRMAQVIGKAVKPLLK